MTFWQKLKKGKRRDLVRRISKSNLWGMLCELKSDAFFHRLYNTMTSKKLTAATGSRQMAGQLDIDSLLNILGKGSGKAKKAVKGNLKDIFGAYKHLNLVGSKGRIQNLRRESLEERRQDRALWNERTRNLEEFADKAKKSVDDIADDLSDQVSEGITKGVEKGLDDVKKKAKTKSKSRDAFSGEETLVGSLLVGLGSVFDSVLKSGEEMEQDFSSMTSQIMMEVGKTRAEAFKLRRELLTMVSSEFVKKTELGVMKMEDWKEALQKVVNMGVKNTDVLYRMTEALAKASKLFPDVDFSSLEMFNEVIIQFEYGTEIMEELLMSARQFSREFMVEPQKLFDAQTRFHRYVRATAMDSASYQRAMINIQRTVTALESSLIDSGKIMEEVLEMGLKPLSDAQDDIVKLGLLGINPIQWRHLTLTDPGRAAEVFMQAQVKFFSQWFSGGKFVGGPLEAEQFRIIVSRFGFDMEQVFDLMGGKADELRKAFGITQSVEERILNSSQSIEQMIKDSVFITLKDKFEEFFQKFKETNKTISKIFDELEQMNLTFGSILFLLGLARLGRGGLGWIKGLAGKKLVGLFPSLASAARGVAAGGAAAGGVGRLALGPPTLAAGVARAIPYGTMVYGAMRSLADFITAETKEEKQKAAWTGAGRLGGTLAGMKLGAAIGSLILPGAGTLVGGALGSLIGLFGGEKLVDAVYGNWDKMKEAGTGFTEYIKEKAKSGWEYITDNWKSSWETVTNWWRELWGFSIKNVWNNFREAFIEPFRKFFKPLTGVTLADVIQYALKLGGTGGGPAMSGFTGISWGYRAPLSRRRGSYGGPIGRGLDTSKSSFTYISSGYGIREGGHHGGVDLATGGKNIPLYSNIEGTVFRVGYEGDGAGHYLVIKDKDGLYHYYMHLKDRPNINVGQEIKFKQRLGTVGETGNANGIHLHYEVRTLPQRGHDINPLAWLGGFGVTGTGVKEPEYDVTLGTRLTNIYEGYEDLFWSAYGGFKEVWKKAFPYFDFLFGNKKPSDADLVKGFRWLEMKGGVVYDADLLKRFREMERASLIAKHADDITYRLANLTFEDESEAVRSWFTRTPDMEIISRYNMTHDQIEAAIQKDREEKNKELKVITGKRSIIEALPVMRKTLEDLYTSPGIIALSLLEQKNKWGDSFLIGNEIGMAAAHKEAERLRSLARYRGFPRELYDPNTTYETLLDMVEKEINQGDYLIRPDLLSDVMKLSPAELALGIIEQKGKWGEANKVNNRFMKSMAHSIAETYRKAAWLNNFPETLYDRTASEADLEKFIEEYKKQYEYPLPLPDTGAPVEYNQLLGSIAERGEGRASGSQLSILPPDSGGGDKIVDTLVWTASRLEKKFDELKANVDAREALYEYYRSQNRRNPFASYG